MHNTLYRVRRLRQVPTISTADIFRQPFAGLTTYPLLFSLVACPLQQDSRRFDFICPLVIFFFFRERVLRSRSAGALLYFYYDLLLEGHRGCFMVVCAILLFSEDTRVEQF